MLSLTVLFDPNQALTLERLRGKYAVATLEEYIARAALDQLPRNTTVPSYAPTVPSFSVTVDQPAPTVPTIADAPPPERKVRGVPVKPPTILHLRLKRAEAREKLKMSGARHMAAPSKTFSQPVDYDQLDALFVSRYESLSPDQVAVMYSYLCGSNQGDVAEQFFGGSYSRAKAALLSAFLTLRGKDGSGAPPIPVAPDSAPDITYGSAVQRRVTNPNFKLGNVKVSQTLRNSDITLTKLDTLFEVRQSRLTPLDRKAFYTFLCGEPIKDIAAVYNILRTAVPARLRASFQTMLKP